MSMQKKSEQTSIDCEIDFVYKKHLCIDNLNIFKYSYWETIFCFKIMLKFSYNVYEVKHKEPNKLSKGVLSNEQANKKWFCVI